MIGFNAAQFPDKGYFVGHIAEVIHQGFDVFENWGSKQHLL
jgi:hypothetical protein